MPIFEISVSEELPELDELLKKLEPAQLAGAMKNVGEAAVGLARESFQKGEDPHGVKWTPLTESTLSAIVRPGRRRRQYGTRPLVRTSTLANSLNWELVTDGTAVKVGASQRYGVYHQGDPSVQSKNIVPQRAFLPIPGKGLPDAWRDELIDAVESYLDVKE